ncbi:DEAD/DEAH box helicase [Cupriavidus basilensis]|uniref:DEAD/DEAH box helicase n=1 Tax=Cupriavidus basilensis TaxID=68895 RepID=UPI00157B8CC0|nr:3'-5' exonuclease [Cupriavidus basilensis]NUA27930.1 DNA helicase II [Cupriavidus basilensis]
MATLIPALGSVTSRMTGGERRFAERLETKLEDDYLCWYDVAIGEKTRHPDFIVFHPSRGLLVLEVKDWKLSTIQSMDQRTATLITERGVVHEMNPLEQARQFMFYVLDLLQRDPQLVWPTGSLKGKPFFPYGAGIVLANITRAQFEQTNLGEVLPAHLVICKDEMAPEAEPEAFQKRLWEMFPVKFTFKLSLPQIDRIRWHLFPQIRMPEQRALFPEDIQDPQDIPDILRVMDLQQEQLARSLGEGHRVIHGVAGSGKTLILGYRAEYLAKAATRPILVLCFNKTLAAKLSATMVEKGIEDKVHVHNFHAWCSRQLQAFNIDLPKGRADDALFESFVSRVIEGVERKAIPGGQYDAVLIDEGHDFRPEWFKLVVQMINPDSNSLLVLYDDAQSIYGGTKKRKFSFASVGVQAKGRTTILKINYRNTQEILAVARAFADDLLRPNDNGEDEAPTVQPIGAGRRGQKPLLIALPTIEAEAERIAQVLLEENRTGTAWAEMAIIYRHWETAGKVTSVLARKGIPFECPQITKRFTPGGDSVKVVTMHSSKGLEFPLVCIPGVGAPHKKEESIEDEARLLYVAMTRATRQLVMTHGETSHFSARLRAALDKLA